MPTARQQAKLAKLEQRANLPQTWLAPLMATCPKHPGFFCFAVFCSSCASYSNRTKALHGDMTRYTCCQGACPCSGKMGEKGCPRFCLAMEACFCFAISVQATRWMIQDRLGIQNTKCDNCIIGTMVVLQYLSCCCSIAACLTDSPFLDDAAELVDCIADIAWCSVCACMQTQVRYEMNKNPQWGSGAPLTHTHTQPPPHQNMAYPGGGGGGKVNQPPPQQMMQQPGYGQAPPPGYPPQGQAPPPGYPGGGGYPAMAPPNAGPPPGYPRA